MHAHKVEIRVSYESGGGESERYLTMSTDLDLALGIAVGGFPLTFTWMSWSDFSEVGTKHEVTYSIVSGELRRSYSVDGGVPTVTVVARYIDFANSYCQLAGNKLSVRVSAVAGDGPAAASESRVYTVVTRPD